MAVVDKFTKGRFSPGNYSLPEAVFAEGGMRCIISGAIPNANDDSINSRVFFGKVPSAAVILPQSILYHSGITGLTDFDIGIYRDGALIDIDAYADGLNLSSAGNKSMTAALTTGNVGRRVFEVAGLTYDPGCEYDIVGTFKTAATAAGTMEAFLYYAKK